MASSSRPLRRNRGVIAGARVADGKHGHETLVFRAEAFGDGIKLQYVIIILSTTSEYSMQWL